jgi:hypothetical protein
LYCFAFINSLSGGFPVLPFPTRFAYVSLVLTALCFGAAGAAFGQCTPPSSSLLLIGVDAGGRRDTAFFGRGPTATAGVDTFLCERELPPLPPGGVYDLRFTNPPGRDGMQPPSGLGQGTVRDYRAQVSPAQIDTFRVRFQPGNGGYPMTFSWSITALAAACDSARLIDELAGIQYNVNMLAAPSLTVTNPAVSSLLLYVYRIPQLPTTPVLVSPPDGAMNQNTSLLLSWNSSPGATRYAVQLAADSLFGSPLVNDTSVTATSKAVNSLLPGSRYFWRVRAASGAGTSAWSAVSDFTTAGSVTNQYTVNGGWNMISLPLTVPDGRRSVVYPTASSSAFRFGGAGYVSEDSLHSGSGYWLKFPSTQSVGITGGVALSDTIDLQAGWNLIGTISVPVDSGSVVKIPTGLLSSVYYSFSGAYVPADTLQPGKSYWVKATTAGKLVFSAAASPARRIMPQSSRASN